MKSVYVEDLDFVELIQKIGKIWLQYHLTDIVWLLPPGMRVAAIFMNLSD